MPRPGSQRRKSRARAQGPRAPYLDRRLGTFNILSDEGLELIEHNADVILRDTGMEFRDDPEILMIFRDAGCHVDGERVRFDPGFCRKTITDSAPATFPQHARNAENTVRMGGTATVLCPSWGRPSYRIWIRGGGMRPTMTLCAS